MLQRASVADVKSGRVTLEDGEILVVMRYYPRFLRKELITAYLPELSPPMELVRELKELSKSCGDHNLAFREVCFAERFELTPKGQELLKALAERGREQTIYLVCQCSAEQRCHCDQLIEWSLDFTERP